MLRQNRDDQNANFQGRLNPLSAKTPKHVEFGLVAMSEAQPFGISSLPSAVESQRGEGRDQLDQQSMLAHDTLFGPLSSLHYDIDPELFNAQFNSYNDEMLWLGNSGER